MNILYLHQYFNTPAMSGGTRSYEMARRLVRAGHTVHIVTTARNPAPEWLGRWKETDEAGINVHWFGLPYSNRMSYARRARAFLAFSWHAGRRAARLKSDVIFATSTPLTIALPAARAARLQGIPMVFEVRDLWPEIPIAVGALRNPLTIRGARLLERFAYRNSAHIVALSPGMKAGVVRSGYAEDRVSVLPNSCDFDLFDVPASAGRELRARHGWTDDTRLVVYTGTLGYINGVGYLARLAAEMRGLDDRVVFAVVGGGREEEEVRRLASSLGVLGENFFLFPEVSKSEIAAWLSAADMATSTVIDMPELQANSANKFFDALAAGRPIAINYGGWHAELIDRHDCGIVLHPTDTRQSAGRLKEALSDPRWLQSASQGASRLGREQFSRCHLAGKLNEILQQTVTEHGGR